MEYLISEEELKNAIYKYAQTSIYWLLLSKAEEIANTVLKSKQPVEKIASGNFERITWKPFKENPIGKVFSGEPMTIYIKRVSK